MNIIKRSLIKKENNNPWNWIPTLYFAEGFPYAIVIFVSALMYKRLGISNSDIALYTSWLYLPWILKPLWSPIVDVFGKKRKWILLSQLLIGAALACVGFAIPMPDFFQFTLIIFWLLAFISATHEIPVDGFYLLALKESRQSFFIGFRTTFFRVALIAGQGLVIILAGQIENVLTVSPAEFHVVANPKKFFEETIKVDSQRAKELPGKLHLVAKPSYLEISTKPKTKEQVNFYKNFAKNFNLMNGFSREQADSFVDTTRSQDLVGNVGIAKFFLSKKPSDGDEYVVNVEFQDGEKGIKVIEGNKLYFNSGNWNKPAFAIFQLDSNVTTKTTALFSARTDKVPMAWSITFLILAGMFILFFIYHKFILPEPETDVKAGSNRTSTAGKEFFRSFARYFEKKKIIIIILFLISYRFGEAQLSKLSGPFLLDNRELGGLGLSLTSVGWITTLGTIAFILSGIIGGILISKKGLKFWMWPMFISINIPSLIYLGLSLLQPQNFWLIAACTVIEQFGFGFGFTFYVMYMIFISDGEYKTSHYAISAGFMALGMMLPGMISGIIQEAIGYKLFFLWVIFTTIPSFIVLKYIPIEYGFGKKKLIEE